MRISSNKSGFTLVEMSIVLVIIGLIVGSVLVGRDLIRAAELRSVITDVEKIRTSVNAFKLKYACLPGDCPNITSYFTTATNGNGDFKIGKFPGGTYSEVWQFWYHIAQANMWEGAFTGTGTGRTMIPGTNVAASKFSPKIGYTVIYSGGYTDGNDWLPAGSGFGSNKYHSIFVGMSDSNGTAETYAPAFTPAEASSLDTKADDGLPGTGIWIHSSPILFTHCATTTNSTTAVYNASYTVTAPACGFMLKAGF